VRVPAWLGASGTFATGILRGGNPLSQTWRDRLRGAAAGAAITHSRPMVHPRLCRYRLHSPARLKRHTRTPRRRSGSRHRESLDLATGRPGFPLYYACTSVLLCRYVCRLWFMLARLSPFLPMCFPLIELARPSPFLRMCFCYIVLRVRSCVCLEEEQRVIEYGRNCVRLAGKLL